ncbi:hypothetical protein CH63R_03484 [Colletotrichum higginsianum IMI 349063]|uniref:Uncharacterized protein n=1 Tax=Colletotrichum higginsianum (strain IMI 349063) TaxID=759273 RepID=A0A1B7YS89_COLHI|nr:hypothetical protein CH63R_03484 [Colletotrichum higginsianum IMI 349063]OBR14758.1 hypothetical protein CH63R_03484 [Colletotrichum higginsianum IMI 349063]
MGVWARCLMQEVGGWVARDWTAGSGLSRLLISQSPSSVSNHGPSRALWHCTAFAWTAESSLSVQPSAYLQVSPTILGLRKGITYASTQGTRICSACMVWQRGQARAIEPFSNFADQPIPRECPCLPKRQHRPAGERQQRKTEKGDGCASIASQSTSQPVASPCRSVWMDPDRPNHQKHASGDKAQPESRLTELLIRPPAFFALPTSLACSIPKSCVQRHGFYSDGSAMLCRFGPETGPRSPVLSASVRRLTDLTACSDSAMPSSLLGSPVPLRTIMVCNNLSRTCVRCSLFRSILRVACAHSVLSTTPSRPPTPHFRTGGGAVVWNAVKHTGPSGRIQHVETAIPEFHAYFGISKLVNGFKTSLFAQNSSSAFR